MFFLTISVLSSSLCDSRSFSSIFLSSWFSSFFFLKSGYSFYKESAPLMASRSSFSPHPEMPAHPSPETPGATRSDLGVLPSHETTYLSFPQRYKVPPDWE